MVDDADVVAAIAAGELDGLAVALDRYAVPLYDYCYATAPSVAAEAVHDTFVIAWSKLDGLRDPADLSGWLEAVAGNECFRRTLASGDGEPGDGQPGAGAPPRLPPGLPGQVLSACADNTPAGRAYRVSLTHRAGPFGPDGFPRAGRWRRPGGRRRVAAVVAVAVATAAAAALVTAVAFQPASDPRHDQASAARPSRHSGAGPAASGAALPTTPARRASPSASSTTTRPGSGAKPRGGTGSVARPPVAMPPAKPPAPAPPAAPMAAVSPAQGVLTVIPPKLVLVPGPGGTLAKTLMITANGGPVTDYTISVPAGLPGTLTVSPSSGSLADGGSATITVTATSAVPFATALTLYPGGEVILVVVKTKG